MKYRTEHIEFLRNKNYLHDDESIEDRIETIVSVVKRYEDDYYFGLADRIRFYLQEQILSPSTPQWANLGRGDKTLPVSCYITTPNNSIQGIYTAIGETAMMSKLGGGVGADFTDICDKGTLLEEGFYTNSKLDWMEILVGTAQKVSQGNKRRGYAVPFISIDDPELEDLMKRADKKNPNEDDVFVDNNIGIILPVGFRQRLKDGDLEARRRYKLVLNIRESSGKVYILDIENCNKNQSPVYEKLGHTVSSTNICTEVLTPKYDDKSFTCVIASLNLVYWDKIKKDEQIIKDIYAFLDINVSEFIRLTEGTPFMEKARRSAIEKRDIGLGTLGFHEYLQSKNYVFGDLDSQFANEDIYSTIRRVGEEFTKETAERLGSPAMCQEADMVRRNVSLMMIAPNKSTSFICGTTSLGIEPFLSNYFVKTLAGKQYTFRNQNLKKVLKELGENTIEVWSSILNNLGSVQHLNFLTDHQKNVFRTASEISPKEMIDLAAQRQKHIDMAQSLNLWNRPNYSKKDIRAIHKYAFDNGIKTLYYYWSQAHAANEQNGEEWDTCVGCAD